MSKAGSSWRPPQYAPPACLRVAKGSERYTPWVLRQCPIWPTAYRGIQRVDSSVCWGHRGDRWGAVIASMVRFRLYLVLWQTEHSVV